ncbi:MAG: LacI family DNA-binding transcriptional regulator [Atopobiaceae bacterium]|nr:LacI family transcriptional regulator [Atopobiaceae bacterium]MCH4181318.1 LacI family transcriptional regulator [Atopobiaceae bacterium]MCH4215067.1 LacI family transcriptional regulator [Atopobiaceae bacterium]MCH4230619.1 LacI family transcriptional regulator [Atopobiaceae bacterium]MCH4276782.1 LacI family transcriptional regulator [Atopobiaceae bacterium]
MSDKVTLRDIADEVGLSITSVSLVLNDKPCRLSPASKDRIRECATRLHYVPNQIARSLVMRQTHTLGLVVPNIESRFFASLAKSLEERCRQDGYALFITNSNDRSESDLELIRMLVERGVDGLFLVVSSEVGENDELVRAISELSVPAVLVDRVLDGVPCDRVQFDNELGAYLACHYLIECGHKRVAAVVNATGSRSGRERLAGYRRAMREADLPVAPEYVIEADYHIPSGYAAGATLMGTDATAVFASSDNIALGLLKYLHEQGMRVPEDYSIVSYDNSVADTLFEPTLAAVDQDVVMLAEHAVSMLRERLVDGRTEPRQELLAPRLVQGGSVR